MFSVIVCDTDTLVRIPFEVVVKDVLEYLDLTSMRCCFGNVFGPFNALLLNQIFDDMHMSRPRCSLTSFFVKTAPIDTLETVYSLPIFFAAEQLHQWQVPMERCGSGGRRPSFATRFGVGKQRRGTDEGSSSRAVWETRTRRHLPPPSLHRDRHIKREANP